MHQLHHPRLASSALGLTLLAASGAAVSAVASPAIAGSTAISTVADLDLMRTTPGGDFYLANDLDLTNVAFIPIGSSTTPFTGSLDGQGHSIANLTLQDCAGQDLVGFFGVTDGAAISNLHLGDVSIAGDEFVGALVGQARDTEIMRCSATGTVAGRSQVGGLAGFLGNSDAKSSWTDVDVGVCETVFLPGKWHGGFAGHVHPYRLPGRGPSSTGDGSTVSDCHALGDVAGIYVAGGFVGNFHGSLAQNCFAVGDVETSRSFAGGFAGYIQQEPGVGDAPIPLTARLNECNAYGMATTNDFGSISELQSLGIWDSSFSVTPMPSAGGFVAYCEGGLDDAEEPYPNVLIDRCGARGDVLTLEDSRGLTTPTGGFAGFTEIETVITESIATGSVTAEFMSSVGGFVGWSEGVIEDSTAHGDVLASDRCGAFGGQNAAIRNAVTGTPGPFGGKFRRCASYGDIVATDDPSNGIVAVGGFVGYLFSDVELEDCEGHGSVSTVGGWAGGFVGHASRNTIRRCASFGPIFTQSKNVGGFLGRSRLHGGIVIEDCYTHSDVIYVGPDDPAKRASLGGFVGSAEVSTTIRRCYSVGTVVATGLTVGGFVGNSTSLTFSGCHWDQQASLQDGSQPTGIDGHSTAQMRKQATFAGWDFVGVWRIVEDVTYPFLQ